MAGGFTGLGKLSGGTVEGGGGVTGGGMLPGGGVTGGTTFGGPGFTGSGMDGGSGGRLSDPGRPVGGIAAPGPVTDVEFVPTVPVLVDAPVPPRVPELSVVPPTAVSDRKNWTEG